VTWIWRRWSRRAASATSPDAKMPWCLPHDKMTQQAMATGPGIDLQQAQKFFAEAKDVTVHVAATQFVWKCLLR